MQLESFETSDWLPMGARTNQATPQVSLLELALQVETAQLQSKNTNQAKINKNQDRLIWKNISWFKKKNKPNRLALPPI